MNPKLKKAILYGSIALTSVIIAAEHQPGDPWAWVKLTASCVLAVANALKALDSKGSE